MSNRTVQFYPSLHSFFRTQKNSQGWGHWRAWRWRRLLTIVPLVLCRGKYSQGFLAVDQNGRHLLSAKISRKIPFPLPLYRSTNQTRAVDSWKGSRPFCDSAYIPTFCHFCLSRLDPKLLQCFASRCNERDCYRSMPQINKDLDCALPKRLRILLIFFYALILCLYLFGFGFNFSL